jgi:hypothetical protein
MHCHMDSHCVSDFFFVVVSNAHRCTPVAPRDRNRSTMSF